MDIISFLREIGRYFKKNVVVTIFFFITIIVGATNIFGLSKQPAYKCWVLSAFVFTTGYTIVFYIFGYFINGYFKNLGGNKSVAILVIHIPLVLITLFIATPYLGIFRNTPGRLATLILMFVFAISYSIINWSLHLHFQNESDSIDAPECETEDKIKAKIAKIKSENTGDNTQDKIAALEGILKNIKLKIKYSGLATDFRSTVFMSDLPLAIAFLVLTIYSIFIDYCIQMDYFFSGAIAFQMMASNAVWIFNDDKIFTKLEE